MALERIRSMVGINCNPAMPVPAPGFIPASPPRTGIFRLLVIAMALLAAGSTWIAATRHADRINTSASKTDQGAYLAEAQRWRARGDTYQTKRNRMPLYPWLLKPLIPVAEKSGQDFFHVAKRANIALTIAAGFILLAVALRTLPWPAALAFHLVSTLSLLAYRAGYVQCEVLFFLLFFLTLISMVRLLERPGPLLAAATGLLAATAYLTKASALAAGFLFLGLAAARFLFDAWRHARDGGGWRRFPWRSLAAAPVFAAAFLVVAGPYLATNKRVFTKYFYNVNSFYMWTDSWEEAKEITKKAGDRRGWPDLPPDQIPSARKWFREHSASETVARLVRGSKSIVREAKGNYGYYPYFVALALACMAGALRNRTWFAASLRRHPWSVLFILGLAGGYWLLTAWYLDYACSHRVILPLALPLLFLLCYGIGRLMESAPDALTRLWARRFALAVCLVMPLHSIYLLGYDLQQHYAGD